LFQQLLAFFAFLFAFEFTAGLISQRSTVQTSTLG
jgi:hypothetical protein